MATQTIGLTSESGTYDVRSVSDLVLHGTTQHPTSAVSNLVKLVQPALTPDYASNPFFQGPLNNQAGKLKPFQTYQSEVKSTLQTQPSNRSGTQATEEIKDTAI